MHSKHLKTRSDRLGVRLRETSPLPLWRPPPCRQSYPAKVKPLQSEHQPRTTWERSLYRASFLRQAQEQAERLPLHRLPPALTQEDSFTEQTPLGHFGLEEQTGKLQNNALPPTQLELDKLELEDDSCNQRVQLREALEAMQQAVHSLAAKLAKAKASKQDDNNNNNNNDETTTNNNNNNQHNNHTDNNNNNHDNNNNKSSRESGLHSFDLDKTNPGSQPDLDGESLGSFPRTLGDESSTTGLDHREASLSFNNLGHNKTMTIGLSLGSFSQNNNKDGQEGKRVNTASSFDSQRAKLGQQKPGKRVTFGTVTLKAYNPECELHSENNKRTTCWDSFRQENAMQQQTATASGKELQKAYQQQQQNNSLGREEQTLGNIQQACRCPSNMNNNNLGTIGKNKAAWGILVDTGAAISLAPPGFAQQSELMPAESTLQLRAVNGSFITIYGRRTVELRTPNLCLLVSFVIANVSQALIGMDILMANQLSLIRCFDGFHLVNSAGAKIQLQSTGWLLYLPAFPVEAGFSQCKGSNLPTTSGSLLDDKGRTQEAPCTSSGGACEHSFPLENLGQEQAKNTATLGTTTDCQEEGAKRKRRKKKKKKPSAKAASQDPIDQRSLGQKGQKPAASQLRNSQKLRIIKEIELAAEKPNSLGNKELQEISLRILLTLSLRQGWQLTMTRATPACSEDALQNHLRSLGLDQNKMDQHLFSGDELVILQHKRDILIAGSELQQEDLFCELSALVSLEHTQKLGEDAQVSFCNRTLEHKASSNTIIIALEPCFVHDLLCRHELEHEEPLGSLDEEEPCNNASEPTCALDAYKQELYKHSVGELAWATTTCRPDLCFEVMQLTQSIDKPTTKDEMQLHKVLRYLAGTLHYNLSLHTKIQIAKKEAENLELLAFSATSGTRACHSTALFLWDVPLITSCKEACAQNQDEAELQAVNLSLAMAVHSRKLLQQLDMDQLGQDVKIGLKTSSFQEELVDRKPIAMQLGLSRRNKHQQLRDQLQISRVHPYKNLAESLIYNASGEEVLAKLRIDTGAAETLALPTELCFVSLFSSSSLVGMVSLEPPMEEPQLRQLALSESCFESLSKNLAERSLTSLTVPSLSLEKIDSESLTLCSLSLPLSKGDRFSSLTEMSLSLTEANLDSLIFSNWSFPTGSLTLDNLSRKEDRLQSLTLQSLSLNNEKASRE